MNATQTTMYQCSDCAELHYDELDAQICCAPEPEEVTAWACGVCGTTWVDQDQARKCCWDGETDLEPYHPTPAELEIAGQQRLSI